MPIENEFHPPFLALAIRAFETMPHDDFGTIYDLYGETPFENTKFDAKILKTFLQDLLALKAESGVAKVNVQQYPSNDNWGSLTNKMIARMDEADQRYVWTRFFHFRRADVAALKRLYIHAKAPIQTNGLAILRELVRLQVRLPGMSNVKIASPGCTGRADTIVAYFSDKESLQKVIDALQTATFRAEWFDVGVPLGTLPLGYLNKPGVAGADEVPEENNTFGPASYGAFLSGLIFRGYKFVYKPWLSKNPTAATPACKEKFLQGVLAACAVAEVSAKTIYLTQQDYRKLSFTAEEMAAYVAQNRL